ncbi:MAG: hypothetical protein ACOX5W_00100 [Bacillota bacterium]
MSTIKSWQELENYLKKNPDVVLKQNIGKVIEYECPECKSTQKIEIISANKGMCENCSREIEITLVIE